MSLEAGTLSNQTTMSLDERFTQLRREAMMNPRGARARIEARVLASSNKNRRLALQMARRPAVLAALNIRRGRGLVRNSIGLSQASRGGGRFGRTNRGSNMNTRPLRRGGLSRLSRSQSLQSLTGRGMGMTSLRGGVGGVRLRGRGGGRLSRSASLTRFNVRRTQTEGVAPRRGISNFRGRTRGGSFRHGNVGVTRGRGSDRRGMSWRGRRGGRGGTRRPSQEPPKPPNKETLDKELDQYMSSSKIMLDKQIDQYMNQPQEEKWD